jgi:AcrR family transcriptional regulator
MHSTRQRLIEAALALFGTQGVTETTTKQIAELAEVNEVTLFRQFGNKHGLLLAVIEEAAVFTQLGQTLVQQMSPTDSLPTVLRDYANAGLAALERVPQVVRSVIGEAGQYPPENLTALGRGFSQANQYVATYFKTVMAAGQLVTHLSAEQLASLLHGLLLGYAVIEFTSEFHDLWRDRDDFLDNLVTLFLQGAVAPMLNVLPPAPVSIVADLPTSLVHTILQQAKKASVQDYALIYVLFAAGLSAVELVGLRRSQHIHTSQEQFLQVGPARQVPINQWILSKRYGTYLNNPLTKWLKSRKDGQPALFLNLAGTPLTTLDLQQHWQTLTAGLLTPAGHPPKLDQTRQTWCVEMLMRGLTLEAMQLLTGLEPDQIQPFAQRAKEKAALEQALRLDQKNA